MRWPLIARSAFDVLEAETARLRTQNDTLQDVLIRIARRKEGMAEVGQTPGPRKQLVIPEPVQKIINGVDRPEYRQMAKNRALQLYRELRGDWTAVEQKLAAEAE